MNKTKKYETKQKNMKQTDKTCFTFHDMKQNKTCFMTKYDKTCFMSTKHDKTKQNKIKHDKTKQHDKT